MASQLAALGDTNVSVVSVDPKVGGYNHDITSPPVVARLTQLASDHRCLGVLGSIPCKTWSPARGVLGRGTLQYSRPLRDRHHRLGFRDENGKLPLAVEKANSMADILAGLCGLVHNHGGSFII